MKKRIDLNGHFEDAVLFNWQPMESFRLGDVTVCHNPSKCVLDTLPFVQV